MESLGEVGAGIDLDHIVSFVAERLRTRTSRDEANVSFRRTAAKENCDPRHCAGRPMRLISHSSCTPNFSLTRARTSSPSASMSPALASPVLIRKLQCFSETCAAPCIRPRQPDWSINCQALWPEGLVKVDPPVLLRTG